MSDTPVLPLPPSYDWGLVVGRSISAIADTVADPDRHPEARGSNGRVTFTPHTRYKKELSAPTAFVQFEVVTAKIVNGTLVDAQGEDGIYLISGAYKVAFTIDSGSIPGFDILVTPEHTLENPLDLVTAAPFVPEDGGPPVTTAIIPSGAAEDQVLAWRNNRLVWVNGSVQAEAAADRAEAAATAAEEWTPSFAWDGSKLVIDGEPGPDLTGPQGDNGDITAGRMLDDEDLDTLTRTEFLTKISAQSATLELNYPVDRRAVHLQVIGSDDRYVMQIATPLVSSTAHPWHWRTKFGSNWGPWQAVLSAYDSGWRDITSLLDPDYLALNPDSTVQIRRIGSEVTMNFSQGVNATASGLYPVVLLLPEGFRTSRDGRPWGSPGLDVQTGKQVVDGSGIYLDTSGWRVNLNATPGKRYAFTMRWTTHEDPPTSPPGDPA